LKFSVIIPTYNRANFIKKTIRTVLDQEYFNLQLIVVDDGSTDNTEEIVSQIIDSRLEYYKISNSERGAARNFGINKSIGDYVTFLDSDDLWYSNHLKLALDSINLWGFPYCFHMNFEIKDKYDKILRKAKLNKTLNELIILGNPMACQGVFLKNEFAKSNLFNEDRELSGLEDWELWLRIATKTKIYFNINVTSCMIQHDDRSVTNFNVDKLIRSINLFIETVEANKDITSTYKSKIRNFKSSCYTYVSLHLALTKKHKLTSLKYLFSGLRYNIFFIFSRRFLAIIKNIICL
jgi:glycosyltransferase involved in cell wall biosynthesis